MKHSSISLDDAESVRDLHEKALEKFHTKVVTRENLITTSEQRFRATLDDALKAYEMLEEASLGISERLKNLAKIISVVGYYRNMPFSFTTIGTTGMTTLITLSGKYGYDLCGSYELLRRIKEHEEDPKFIADLQKKTANKIVEYIESHEKEKIRNLRELKNKWPYVSRPIVYASGSYPRGRLGRSEMVSAWGELLQSKLFFINMPKEKVEEIDKYIDNLSLRPDIKELIKKEIRSRSVDELFSGHNLNAKIFIDNIDGINRLIAQYLERQGRHRGCMEIYEWEGLFTELFPYPIIGEETFYNPRKVDLKIKYVNARLEPLGLGRVRYSEERVINA